MNFNWIIFTSKAASFEFNEGITYEVYNQLFIKQLN